MNASKESAPAPPGPGRPLHPEGRPVAAFTVDVEDWYQSSYDPRAAISERVSDNVERVLAVLEEHAVKATFFVQGMVARRFPGMVQRLVALGHEVQSHGDTHRPLFEMDRAGLRRELEAARKSVADAAGCEVTAFRAADFSIRNENLWALEEIAAQGFRVDSSVFPVRLRRYGIAGWASGPQRLRFAGGGELLEVPVATWGEGRLRLPVGGGGYFRLLPLALLLRGLRACIERGRPPVVYCHPYEFNSDELDGYRGRVPWSVRFQQGLGRRALAARMRGVLGALPFGRLDAVLRTWGLE